jgi:hypothetical protein
VQVAVRKIRSHDLFKILLLEKSGDFWTIYVVLFVMKLTSLGIRVGGGHSNRKLRY